jgi:hypothetical protein
LGGGRTGAKAAAMLCVCALARRSVVTTADVERERGLGLRRSVWRCASAMCLAVLGRGRLTDGGRRQGA